MRRGSTPIITLSVDGETFANSKIFVTIDQDGTQITKDSDGTDLKKTIIYDEETGEAIGSELAVYLSQADTLKLEVGKARVQIRWIDYLHNAYVSDISTIDLEEVLLESEIEYGN